ncbi:Transposase [Mycobacterium basiliense]|uniref:Transposase n=1 Tax=Mycobacterium basiliense TaxID=2094119 RepID=A0A3S4DTC0_9MYCO|nr:IS481 family transposase [Mycobacterium basiliense]VDM88793.1 Transposase [Mycobacterium basiliense]
MLRELRVSEMRYRAVLEVLDGAVISAVARRYGVSRQTVHTWLRRYARDGAVLNLKDRSSRPHGCPHQMAAAVEARVLVLRDAHPRWGPTRIVYELGREGVAPVPGRSSVYRALVRNGRIDPAKRRRRRGDYKRWERGRPMELWQMDVVGGVHLRDGVEVKVVTGIDDNSRFVVSAKVVARATAQPVCEALLGALARHGVPEQILTDNGKVFTGRFGPGGSSSEVLFDRVCVENGIRHVLTAPRSPTTTGKVERLHKTMRGEFFTDADRVFATIAELQAALDRWVGYYNTERPHQSLGMRPPAQRFAFATGPELVVVKPVAAVATNGQWRAASLRADLRSAGVQRWVDQHGAIRLAGFRYRVPIVLAGEPVQAVVADNLVQIYHRDVLVASHAQRKAADSTPRPPRQGRRTARPVTSGIVVTRVVDNNGDVSFAGTMYRAGRPWRKKQVEVSIVAGSVQISHQSTIVRTHAIRHDRAKQHGAFATPHGRPRKPRQDAPDGPGVKATPLRGRPEGRALTPAP